MNPSAAILIIGDEILSGRTKDKNSGWLAEQLNALGIQLVEARVIPDIEAVIARHVRMLSAQVDYLFTSGGIGPTHDDITTQSIARAFGVAVEQNTEAMQRLIAHYRDTDTTLNAARQKMANIPVGATLIDNPISAAPGFIMQNTYVMAGVPSILQAMFSGFAHSLVGGVPATRITVQCATGEGNIAVIMEQIGSEAGISVGSYPWFKQDQFGTDQFGTAIVVSGLDGVQTTAAARRLLVAIQHAGFEAEIEAS